MTNGPRRGQRVDRALFGPSPFRGVVGVARAFVVFLVMGYVVSCLVDLAFGDTPDWTNNGRTAVLFAVGVTMIYRYRTRRR